MKPKKKVIIQSVDENAGRVLIEATSIEDGTGVTVSLNGELWGTGTVQNGQAMVIGRSLLPDTYSLIPAVQPVTKQQPSE